MNFHQNGLAWRSGLITLAIVAVALVIAATQLPQGFSDDLSVIGRGTPVVVQVHDKESMRSQQLMNLLNEIRPEYQDRVEFRVVDIAAMDGQQFVSEQRLDSRMMLVLFDAGGARHEVLSASLDEQALRSAISGVLSQPSR